MRHRIKTPNRKSLLARLRIALFLLASRLAYRIAPHQSTRLFRRWFFRTKPYHLHHAQLALGAQATKLVLEDDSNRINMLEWGAGPVVLLVHGWNGRALQMQPFVQPLLDQGFRVVAFDHIGHAESSSRHSSFLQIVRGTQQVMRHYAADLHGVVAHSIGANAVLKLVEAVPQKLKVVTVAPVDNFPQWLEKIRMRVGIDQSLFAHAIAQIEAETGLKLLEQTSLAYPMIVRHAVLLVHDKFDRINKITASENLQRNLPGAALMVTEALGHARILANPAVVQRVVEHITAK